jgi:hypothetical protein
MRAILTNVANWIDQNLANDADQMGREESMSVRILAIPITEARISVAYQVIADDCQVRILRLNFRR